MPLPIETDPGRQMPMPFQTADDYAQDVMRWAGALHTAGMVAEHAQLTGWPEA